MRILMLGNSLTAANDLPAAVGRLLGPGAEVRAHTRGGARLAEQLNSSTRLGAATQAALAQGGWDVVTLQEASSGAVRTKAAFLRSASALCAQVRGTGAVPVLVATWGYRPGDERLARLGLASEKMARAISEACHEVADVCEGALVADVGIRWAELGSPEGLWAADGVHPSAEGSRVAAEVLAEAAARAVGERGL